MKIEQPPDTGGDPRISWVDFVNFVRQLSHDLRNQLNAAELQAALINELSDDLEVKNEVRRLRTVVSQLGSTLQRLSSSVAEPRPTTLDYPAAELVEHLQTKVSQALPEQAAGICWRGSPSGVSVNIDPNLIEAAVLELIQNAFLHAPGPGPVDLSAEAEADEFVLSLHEPKSPSVQPGAELSQPLRHVSNGHYALGRRRVESILEAHGGRLETTFKENVLTNRMILPCSRPAR